MKWTVLKFFCYGLLVIAGYGNGVVIGAADTGSMTYAQALERMPKRELPKFWIGDIHGLSKRFDALKHGKATIIARSPSGRPIHLISYGEYENVVGTANFNSAMAARVPSAYMNKESRFKPVILFVGPVHGHEIEGLTGLINFIEVMETGMDLRGRDQSHLQKLGKQCRLLIIPAGNPDGISRFEPKSLAGMGQDDLRFWGQGTWADGTLCRWPHSLRIHPMVGKVVGFRGCYYNDHGINLSHDEFFFPMSAEVPAILTVARSEGPDYILSLHSSEIAPSILRPNYVPPDVINSIFLLSKDYYELLDQHELPHGNLFKINDADSKKVSSFNLTSALYHVSGARSFTFECPHGLNSDHACNVSFAQILDIQLLLYEQVMSYALNEKAGMKCSNR
jgi:hypothetical protein